MIKNIRKGSFALFILLALDSAAYAQDPVVASKVGKLLYERHYLHPQIDDKFSADLFDSYLQLLDPGKRIFLQEDIQQLESFKQLLDDEIRGQKTAEFYQKVSKLYRDRYEKAAAMWTSYLSSPINLLSSDSIYVNKKYDLYAKDEQEQQRRWNSALNASYLDRLQSLKQDRKKSKPTDSLYRKTDLQLQAMAREKVRKQNNQYFLRFQKKAEEALYSNYLNAMTLNVDPHTNYFSYADKQAFDQSMANRFFGIGVQLREDDNGNVIVQAVDQAGPCWKNGVIVAGDMIVGVGAHADDPIVDVEGIGVTETTKLIRGPKDSAVRIRYRKTNGTIGVTSIPRAEIKPEESYASSALIENKTSRLGYINLPSFYDDFSKQDGAHCADDVEKELAKLMQQDITGLIIDLRNNGGGSLAQVLKMTGLFIGTGPVVQVSDGANRISVLHSERKEARYTGPLVVLVNELSASASEIFAAAIQDYHRGIIIGSQTLGKGTVQQTMGLGKEEEEGAVKLTTQKFYRIDGGSTQIKGVIPDITLPDAYSLWDVREMNRPKALDWDRIPSANFKTFPSEENDRKVELMNQKIQTTKRWKTLTQTIAELQEQKQLSERGVLNKAYIRLIEKRNQLNGVLPKLIEIGTDEELKLRDVRPNLELKLKKDAYLLEAVRSLTISS